MEDLFEYDGPLNFRNMMAIGDEFRAEIMSNLLGIEIPMNRQNFIQKTNQLAIVLQMKSRPEKGKILSEKK